MESIKNIASLMASLRFLLRFKKKLTFIGIIGNTQGVISAARPKPIPFNKISHQGSLLVSVGWLVVLVVVIFVVLSFVSATGVAVGTGCMALSLLTVICLAVSVLASVVSSPFISIENFLAGGNIHFSSVQTWNSYLPD